MDAAHQLLRSPSAWFGFLGAAALLALFCLIPFAHEYPGMEDYPNHLARLHILLGKLPAGWEKYYVVRHALIPNLGLDVIATAFGRLGMEPNSALRIFAALAFLLLVSGIISVGVVANGSPP